MSTTAPGTSIIRDQRDRGKLYKLDLARARQKLSIVNDDFGRLVQAIAAEDIPLIQSPLALDMTTQATLLLACALSIRKELTSAS